MIKELKVNFYRLFRSKSFWVVSILLVIGAILSAMAIKFFVDDPFNFISEMKDTVTEYSTTEEDAQSVKIIFDSLEQYVNVNSLNGVVQMTLCSDLVCFLHCIVVALFISSEYKSRFHVNRFSLNAAPAFIVFMEWLTLMIEVVIMELICYGVTLGLSVAMCRSFRFDDAAVMAKNASLAIAVMLALASFSFMVAYLRKAGALAIALSSMFAFGVFDFVLGVASIWADWAGHFALNNTMSMITLNQLNPMDYVLKAGAIFLYIACFLGVSLIAAWKRDPY